jgi:hypothetical protein
MNQNNHNYTHAERERERPKYWLWVILGVVLVGGIGAGVYYFIKQNTETKSQSFEEQVQTLNNHLVELQEYSAILDSSIAQIETSLQSKKQEQIQNPSDSNLPIEINQLEQQLTTCKTQKEKLENILPKLEQQTFNLKSKEKAGVIQELEQEIKKNIKEFQFNDNLKIKTPDLSTSTYKDLEDDTLIIQQYLENCNKINEANPNNLTKTADGRRWYEVCKAKYEEGLQHIRDIRAKFMGYNPNQDDIIDCRTTFRKKWSNIFDPQAPKKPDKPDNPTPPSPQPNPQNYIQLFQRLQGQVSELNTLLEKINRDYQEVRDKYDALPQMSRDMIENMFKDYVSVKSFINSLDPLGNGKLNEYASDSDYQIFLSASPETQKINLELFEGNFDLVLKETKESLENNIFHYFEKVTKWGEDWIKEMKRMGADPLTISNAQFEIDKQKFLISKKNVRFRDFNQETIAEKIEAIQKTYQELEEIDWKNRRGN